ncbi:hypothetical protein JXA40_02725 [bacterium]|nr:hypothetical protein [candidate division CSSED10-310 bacterium]
MNATQAVPETFQPASIPDCTETGVTIRMPSNLYHPGDSCFCRAIVCNSSDDPIDGYPLLVLLEVAGEYFFAPGFTRDLDAYSLSFAPGTTSVEVIPEFIWPDGAGSFSGAVWYGALTNPEITELVGNYGMFRFEWTDMAGSTHYKAYCERGIDQCTTLCRTRDGILTAAGRTSWLQGDYDALLVRFDMDGNILRSQIFSADGVDEFKGIDATMDGGWVCTGITQTGGSLGILLVKFDASGNVEWATKTGSGEFVYAEDVVQTRSGEYRVAGYVDPEGNFRMDALLMEFDAGGSVVRARRFDATDFDHFQLVTETPSGDILLFGHSGGLMSTFGVLQKCNPDGSVAWCRKTNTWGSDILCDSGAEFVVAGKYPGRADYNVGLAWFDMSGNVLRSSVIGTGYHDGLNSIRRTADGNLLGSGYTHSSQDDKVILLVKYNDQGSVLWSRAVGHADWEEAYGALEDATGAIELVATTTFYDYYDDLVIIRTDSGGEIYDCSIDYPFSLDVLNITITSEPFQMVEADLQWDSVNVSLNQIDPQFTMEIQCPETSATPTP